LRCIIADMNAGQLHRLARLLRQIAILATAEPDEKAATPGDLAIVEDVADHPRTPIGGIAIRTGLAQSLVSKTVATLRDAGVLVTDTDPEDGRRVLVSLDTEIRTGLRRRGARSIADALRAVKPDADESVQGEIQRLLDDLHTILLPGSAEST